MIQNIFCLIFDNLFSRICAENVECAKLRRDAEFQSKKATEFYEQNCLYQP